MHTRTHIYIQDGELLSACIYTYICKMHTYIHTCMHTHIQDGETCLHAACEGGNKDLVKMLFEVDNDIEKLKKTCKVCACTIHARLCMYICVHTYSDKDIKKLKKSCKVCARAICTYASYVFYMYVLK